MRNVYRDGFDWDKMVPLDIKEGKVIVKAILPSSFDQILTTDHLNEIKYTKIWEVIQLSDGVTKLEKGDVVVVIKAALDGIDADAPEIGLVECRDIACKMPR
jgi:hypothetical protein